MVVIGHGIAVGIDVLARGGQDFALIAYPVVVVVALPGEVPVATNVARSSRGAAVKVHGAGSSRSRAGASQRFRQRRAGDVDEALREMVLVVRGTARRVVTCRAVVVLVRHSVLIVVSRVQRERCDERLRGSGPGGDGQALRLRTGLVGDQGGGVSDRGVEHQDVQESVLAQVGDGHSGGARRPGQRLGSQRSERCARAGKDVKARGRGGQERQVKSGRCIGGEQRHRRNVAPGRGW